MRSFITPIEMYCTCNISNIYLTLFLQSQSIQHCNNFNISNNDEKNSIRQYDSIICYFRWKSFPQNYIEKNPNIVISYLLTSFTAQILFIFLSIFFAAAFHIQSTISMLITTNRNFLAQSKACDRERPLCQYETTWKLEIRIETEKKY